MLVVETIRNKMLEQLTSALVHSSAAKVIKFLDNDNEVLGQVPFTSISKVSISDSASLYAFKSGASSTLSFVSKAGVVSRFAIDGYLDVGGHISEAISGTMGGISSTADVKINKTTWDDGLIVTITNFTLVLK